MEANDRAAEMVQLPKEDAMRILKDLRDSNRMMHRMHHFLAEVVGGLVGADRIKDVDKRLCAVRAAQVRQVAEYYKNHPGVSLKKASRAVFVKVPGGYPSSEALSAYCYTRYDFVEGRRAIVKKEDM